MQLLCLIFPAVQYIKELMAELEANYPEVLKAAIIVNGNLQIPYDALYHTV